jgi:hypothetical protein
MRNNKNNNNDNHTLTPSERVFYQRVALEGTLKLVLFLSYFLNQ